MDLRVTSVSVVALSVLAWLLFALVFVLFATRTSKPGRTLALVRVAHTNTLGTISARLRGTMVLFLAVFACKKTVFPIN